MATIKVPDFNFAVFYYPEILEALIEYKRKNIPEITTENPFDPGVQLLRAYALVGHLNNTKLDLVAQEAYLGTSKLRDSVVRALDLIGYRAAGNIPARTSLRMELTQGFSSDALVVPDNALFGTRRRADTPEVLFEADEGYTVSSTEEVDAAWLYNWSTGLWSNKTTDSNLDANPVTLTAGALLHFYFAHDSALTDSLAFEGVTQGLDLGDDQPGSERFFHLQYYDGNLEDRRPNDVTFPGSAPTAIRFGINGLVGADPKLGTDVFAILNETGARERLPVQYDGENYVETTGFLGQSVVSTDPADYTVGSYWHDVDIATDTTSAPPPIVSAEAFDTGNGALTSFTQTVGRFPLEPGTIVTWDYLVGAVPTQATYDLSDGTLGGSAGVGTTVDPETGIATLVCVAAPDAGTITVDYFREAQTLQQDGVIGFALPLDEDEDWVRDDLPDDLRSVTGPTLEGYWLRFVCSQLGNGTTSDFQYDRARWDSGQMYLRVEVTQGETVSDEILGSGDGTPSQEFELSESPVIQGSVILFVDDEQWTQVDDFFASDETDQHFTIDIDSDGIATVFTGDGTNGVVVPTGANNVLAEYRVGGDDDGNVGANQIIVNRTGISRVRSIRNPRAANGWVPQEGAGDEVDLEKLKRTGVSSLRVLERATSPSDVQFLTSRFQAEDGIFPFARSRAIENGFGLKTIKLVVVPKGGAVPSLLAYRDELDLFFNGDLASGGVQPGVGPSNHEVKTIDYSPVTFDIAATVTGGDEATIRAFLRAAIQPEAVVVDPDTNETTYRWRFGQNIALSNLSGLIFKADDEVESVTLTGPVSEVVILDEELPLVGDIFLTMVDP